MSPPDSPTLSIGADLAGLDLTANRTEPSFGVEPVWRPYYSARESYGSFLDEPLGPTDSLNATFWHRLTEKIETNE